MPRHERYYPKPEMFAAIAYTPSSTSNLYQFTTKAKRTKWKNERLKHNPATIVLYFDATLSHTMTIGKEVISKI